MPSAPPDPRTTGARAASAIVGLARLIFALALLAGGCAGAPGTHAPASAGRYASVRGIRMYYEIHGSGPPLMLLHGGAGNGMQFEKQLPDFSRHYTCIVPDMCEQGRSTGR